jgi:anti-anti-sigma factor
MINGGGMTVSKQVIDDGQGLLIQIAGKFDFHLVHEFRESYQGDRYKSYTLSMERVEHIDSSALGMLLNMRKHLGNDVPIKIKNCTPNIKKIFMISHFDKKFEFI